MRVKRFVGDNVAETMGKVKRELGSEAVILQTRQFKEGGLLGFFGKLKVEITAAIEEKPASKKNLLSPNLKVNNESLSPIQQGPSAPVQGDSSDRNIQLELQNMRLALEKMNKRMTELGGEGQNFPGQLQEWAVFLRERGIGENIIRRLLRQVQHTLREEEWAETARVRQCLEGSVLKICTPTDAIQPGAQKPRIVALIGPTGVGKTTTIGKLAAGFSIVDKRQVAMITADTYRVAAVEQLKTFAEIIGVPVEVVMTPAGLKDALAQHMDKELIFIDTAGRSPHHDLHMSELKAFLDKAQPDFSVLVMSATTSATDQIQVFKRFESLATHLIFTKLDETICTGSILNLLDQTTLPTAYVTNGQNVPDDIEVATPERLKQYILGEGSPNV